MPVYQSKVTMPVEIERKFLVSQLPHSLMPGVGSRLRQGYVAQEGDVEVRVRIVDDDRAFLTVKAGRGLVRTEVEVPVTLEQAEALWTLTLDHRIEKVRHEVVIGEHRVDLDVYGGDLLGLCTAEVEFASQAAAAAFIPPAWFGRDVTGERGWDNASLARHGLPR